MTKPLSEQEIADWLLATLRLFGADETNAHKIIALFLEALHADSI